jgi:hypothetical protein
MIIFYNKITGNIYGTMNGFTSSKVMIKPSNIAEDEVGTFVLSPEDERKSPEVIKDILAYTIKNKKLIK